MALFRKLFLNKPPDGLLEISEGVYVFDCCFTTDAWEEDGYKIYIGGIVGQLKDHFPDASYLVFNFREEGTQTALADALFQYDMTIMDYPRQYEGCPLLTMEMLHHFLRSTESWLSLGHNNLLLMHCEQGGWPVLAFMLAALLIYMKQYSGEQKTLDMIYRQAPKELLNLLSPLNPIPSQLRYLQYVSRRNVASEWPPLDRALTLDCVILRHIPNFDDEGGCRPIFRIYGQDPFLVADQTPKVLYSTPRKSKTVRAYKQAECELVKIDINCHIQGDVVLECISLNDALECEEMMFRAMFNTAFIRSNILMLNRDEIDMLWDVKDLFPKDFRVEILFSEMDAAGSIAAVDFSCFDEEGLPMEAFAKVHEFFNHVDWSDHRADVAPNVLQQISASYIAQDNPDTDSNRSIDISQESWQNHGADVSLNVLEQISASNIVHNKSDTDTHSSTEISHPDRSDHREDVAINVPQISSSNTTQEKSLTDSHRNMELSPLKQETSARKHQERKEHPVSENSSEISLTGFPIIESVPSPNTSPDIYLSKEEALLHDSQAAFQCPSQSDGLHQKMIQSSHSAPINHSSMQDLPYSKAGNHSVNVVSKEVNCLAKASPPVPDIESTNFKSLSASPQSVPLRPSLTSDSANTPPPLPSPIPSHHLSASKSAHSSLAKETETYLQDKDQLSLSNPPSFLSPAIPSSAPLPPPPPPPPPPPIPPLKEKSTVRAGPPLPPPPPLPSGQAASPNISSRVPPPPPPAPTLPSNFSSVPSVPPPPAPFGKGVSGPFSPQPSSSGSNGDKSLSGSPSPGPPPPFTPPTSAKGRNLSRTLSVRSNHTKKLKPLHWLKLTKAVQGSLWAEAQKYGEASKAPEIDMSELESLFSAAVPNSDHGGKLSAHGARGPKSDKVQLIEHRRAYNGEIMLSKVKMPLQDLMSSVLTLEDSALDVDQVDNLIKFCPTKEEMELLKGYNGEKEKLGKCEQFFLELMKVPRVEDKLRVFSFKIQFNSQVSDLKNSLNVVNSATKEIRNSVKLKKIMQTILSLGNALNQGTARGSAIGFRLDGLLKLTETRARNNKMTLMHYLCKVLADKLPEQLDFSNDLPSLEPASKIQLKYLAEEMQAIHKGLEKVVQELAISENDGLVSESFRKTLKGFLGFAEAEVRSLASLYSWVGRNVDALIVYFGEDPARCPFEQVVSTLLNFTRMFNKAHEENCKQLGLEMKKLAESEKSNLGNSHRETDHLPHAAMHSSSVK
ncbi:FH2 domain-containing protein/PTEN_C2 domain-containing protein [Cephalotus follicularis]|uniref:Formin-like protein n=1 Tax=Cephalotus follicularis TaxID=3775 RepID=A0A1Q3CSA7_CEPFO|nr:FH2 domain-containing protein/PTEN_C2 domain-containing protein [Cephalotus follicularis]